MSIRSPHPRPDIARRAVVLSDESLCYTFHISQLKHLSNHSITHQCHTHVKIAYINLQLHRPSLSIPSICGLRASHAAQYLARISHASRAAQSRTHLISSRRHRAVDPLGPPSQRITPYRYPLPQAPHARPPLTRRSCVAPHRQTTSTVVRGFGCAFLLLSVCLPACLPACLRSHIWPTALRSRSGTHCVVQRPQPLQLRLQLRLVGALEVVERRLGRVSGQGKG